MNLQLTAPAPFTKHVEHDEIEMLDGTIAVVRVQITDVDLDQCLYHASTRIYTEASGWKSFIEMDFEKAYPLMELDSLFRLDEMIWDYITAKNVDYFTNAARNEERDEMAWRQA